MKHEWKKHEKGLYGTGAQPVILVVPRQNFIMINGEGDPNKEDFSQRAGVLYSLAHPIKMRFKAFCNSNPELGGQFEYQEYSIFPLEGIWTSSNPENPLDKDSFVYTIMIRQPDFITREMFDTAYEAVEKKKPHRLLKEVVFNTMEDKQCIQMLHKGSFDDEPASFAKMAEFIKDRGLERVGYSHREIYLNDARKTAPDKRHTILRYQIK